MEPVTTTLNFNQLRLFHAVARTGSVTKGAAAIYVSQPSVSKAIHDLEREVGLALFEHVGRGVRLTEAGARLAEYADRLFGLANAAERMLDDLRGLSQGSLRVGASTTVGNYILPELLGQFHALHPGVSLALEIGNTTAMIDALRAFEIDLAVVEGVVSDPGMDVRPFREDELVLLAAPAHPFARMAAIEADDLQTVAFLAREPGSGTREIVDRALAEWGIAPVIAMELGHTEAIKEAIAANLGVSILSSRAVVREVRDGSLAVIPIRGRRVTRTLFRVTRLSMPLAPAVAAFDALLRVEPQG